MEIVPTIISILEGILSFTMISWNVTGVFFCTALLEMSQDSGKISSKPHHLTWPAFQPTKTVTDGRQMA